MCLSTVVLLLDCRWSFLMVSMVIFTFTVWASPDLCLFSKLYHLIHSKEAGFSKAPATLLYCKGHSIPLMFAHDYIYVFIFIFNLSFFCSIPLWKFTMALLFIYIFIFILLIIFIFYIVINCIYLNFLFYLFILFYFQHSLMKIHNGFTIYLLFTYYIWKFTWLLLCIYIYFI